MIRSTPVARSIGESIPTRWQLARGCLCFESGADSVRSTTRAGADAADEYVRGYPWAAVGVAIGVGLLLGFSSRR